jgi:hypothetical protein
MQKGPSTGDPEVATIEPVDTGEVERAGAFAVCETRRLYRLRAGRQIAVVAANTEDEARSLAATHDPLGRDWRKPEVAESEFEETAESHVFGDVVFTSVR